MEKINVAELLKYCPSGMELDCTMCDKVVLVGVDNSLMFPIKVKCKDGCLFALTKYGQCCDSDYAKCVIFPKGKTTWEGFVPPCKFKDGDVVYTAMDSIAILGDRIGEHSEGFHSYCGLYNYEFGTDAVVLPERFATEEEKQKLFQAIKDNGYRWNPETNTLEKLIKPKFKIGDRIRHKTHIRQGNVVTEIKDTHYILDDELALPFISQDEYELVPNKFDITSLKPFDKVLVRIGLLDRWRMQFFEKYDETDKYPFICMWHNKYNQCVPYEGNEHLLGTANDCKEYFKTWK